MNRKHFLTALLAVLLMAMVVLAANALLHKPGRDAYIQEKKDTVHFILPDSSPFSEVIYEGEDPSIRKIYQSDKGYVIETVVDGYVDEIRLMVGVSNEGLVQGITVRDMAETPGLGTQALTDYHFLMQFLHTDGNAVIGENVDAMTGATVTSKAIARGVNSAVAYVTGADAATGATSWGG